MRSHYLKACKTAILALSVLLLGASVSFAQVTLTAAPTATKLADGTVVPMWGYFCGASTGATCSPLNAGTVAPNSWSPVVITVPSGSDLVINLTNHLTIPVTFPSATGAFNNIPTSLVIVGQLGGGLGSTATSTASPTHENLGTTWPAANGGAVFNPPTQGARVQSFSTEVETPGSPVTGTQCASPCTLTWKAPRPGTYLLESGTHPSIQGPMGLYGIVVVTAAPGSNLAGTSTTTGIAYPGVTYNAELPVLLSEIDPVQNNAVQAAASSQGFLESAVHGPYAPSTVGSLNVTNGGSGYTAATANLSAPPCTVNGTTCVQATATAQVDTDNTSSTYQQVTGLTIVNAGMGYTQAPSVAISGNGSGATANAALVLTVAAASCSGGAPACYPPAVNYTPMYYLMNGRAFDKTNAAASVLATSPASGVSGSVLVRMVNAGLRMHVPSVVGSSSTPAIRPTGVAAAAAPGFSLVAEDGNPLPGVSRVQSEVFMPAGKTYDVMIDAPAAVGSPLPIYDRELSLSSNSIGRDGGMLAYIGINGATLPRTGAFAPASTAAAANNDSYPIAPGQTLTVSDPAKGVLANDVNAYGAQLPAAVAGLTLNANGTFTYTGAPTSFQYCINGSAALCATVNITAATADTGAIHCTVPAAPQWTSNVASTFSIAPPGVLAFCTDSAGYALKVTAAHAGANMSSVTADENGGFHANATAPGNALFTFDVQSRFGTTVNGVGPVTISFLAPSHLAVKVLDGADKTTQITDYRWIIEEDRTFYINPLCTQNPPPAGCPTAPGGIVPTFGTNFHTSYMPLIAAGCTGPLSCESGQTVLGAPTVCDIGNGVCEQGAGAGQQQATLDPGTVHLDPTKRYYISILPGDAANPFIGGNGSAPANCAAGSGTTTNLNTDCGHGMGGAPVSCALTAGQIACTSASTFPAITILTQPSPYPTAKLSVFVFEDDFPLNGEQDGGGGIDVLSPNEPGLGGFNIKLFDDAGGSGDATGQITYDMFNMPLSNSLAGTMDPSTGLDACPVVAQATNSLFNTDGSNGSQVGITGEVVTCPKYESDGVTLSPLAGQAVIANLYPGRYGVVATPAADRIARGEEWLQTNTLDGQKAHDSFLRIGEPSFFQEYGPAGFHVSIGFANPAIINARQKYICNGTDANSPNPGQVLNCTNTLKGRVTGEHLSRAPDERLYSSGSNDTFGFTQCYVSFGDPDGEDFAFTKCAADGSFTLTGLPDGDWRVTVFDQWNDMLVDGLSTPVRLAGGTTNIGDIATSQWQANIYTKTFFDQNGNGIQDGTEPGLALVATNIRFRDGSYSNFNNTDLSGNAGFNEVFPLFSWYVVETDTTRYKSTGVHVVYDAGGPTDGTAGGGTSGIGQFYANTGELVSVPTPLRVPGAYYCADADCSTAPIPLNHPANANPYGPGGTTGRIDPPFWFGTYGWQGFSGQNSFLEFGKKPFAAGETGTIHGEVIYASTRPFDDPTLLIHTSWTPDVPGVTINLYKVGTAPDGSDSLTLVDTTKTSSWDDWAQGFRSDGIPNMNCPGQGTNTDPNHPDLFFFSLFNQPMWLDLYSNVMHGSAAAPMALPNSSQFKCYDGMHNWNQMQPAPYDGMYSFPSVVALDTHSGRPIGQGSTNGVRGSIAGSNCTICVPNPDTSDPYRAGTAMLPAGKYVVEMIVPPGYELVKEEDKNILIGDNYIAPATSQFAGLGNIFILPDQAEIGSLANGNNSQNQTQTLGRTTYPNGEGDTGSVEIFWPCVGAMRTVPDFISLFPLSGEVSPFAGAQRPLCDRKEVVLNEQSNVLAKFWIFSSTHVASHYTGVITDDYTSEFDPFSPQFGEKFSPPDLPISVRDWSGTEISRTYADHWGTYDGLTYSTWEVNPPNPTGYAPTMMITCMNDPGPIPDPNNPGQMITDPLFNPEYSQFCYEIPFMPGQTQYMDTPVVPTSAFAGAGYNNPDCAYPNLTPAIKEVDGDEVGPWVSAAGHTLTITAMGDAPVFNNAYSGPSATTAPYNQKTITRHYGFGSTAGTVFLVGSDGVAHNLTGVSWSDTRITGTVPAGVPNCAVQQQSQYGGSTAQCGELVIKAAGGQTSVDTVTVTIGGKAPTHISPAASIQAAIDSARPGDLLIVDPTCNTAGGTVNCTIGGGAGLLPNAGITGTTAAAHNELVIMWKPVRLQGVGAASSIINANTHPAGKLVDWRTRIDCLMGLGVDGAPTSWQASCAAGWSDFRARANVPQVDRLPLEAAVGWTATLNGNLAELLQEPSLMGALEGAGITVLSKGVDFHGADPWTDGNEPGGFPPVTTLLQNGPGGARDHCNDRVNPFPSNFMCNPSSIDGLTVTDSSQGGGGVFVHGWGHNIQIANNRVQNNAGTLSGGINVGQGEFPPAYFQGGATNSAPGSCQNSSFNGVANSQLPYCHDRNVNVHHNYITYNSSTGDELFSATPAGAGGVSFCTGSDFYKFNFNWICGNLSTGDGGGLGQLGFSYNGDIEHNLFLFNQSTNPTIPTNGGAMVIMGSPDVDPTCGATTDTDCVPNPASIGPSDGTGPGLVINANMIVGNQAESGSGGGIALQQVNGSDAVAFPNSRCNAALSYAGGLNGRCRWNSVSLTNNIIVNNVAGWDGGGVSFLDALAVNFINNTVMNNDSTASAGMLFTTLGAPLASTGGTNCTNGTATASCPQPGGVVSIQNSTVLAANLAAAGAITCPAGHGPQCSTYSVPLLYNDVFYHNRSFYIGVGGLGAGTLNQQNIVTLYNSFTPTPAGSQSVTGACPTASYWDIGVRGDTNQTSHPALKLNPFYSFVGSGDYAGNNNSLNVDPVVSAFYCNGSRIPPELGTNGWQVPPGIADATVPNPLFNLTPIATVDEGNNWINISWGPLALMGPTHQGTGTTPDTFLANYAPTSASTTRDYIPSTAANPFGAGSSPFTLAPGTDFFGLVNRKGNNRVDAGAIEFTGGGGGVGANASVSPTSLDFGPWANGTTSNPMMVTVTNTGTVALTGGSFTFPAGSRFSRSGGTCGAVLAIGANCTIGVVFAPNAVAAFNGTLTVAYTGATVAGSPVTLTGSGVATRGTVTIAPNPLRITLNPGVFSSTGVVTLTNAAASASSVAVTSVAVTSGAGSGVLTWFFTDSTLLGGADTCTGVNLAPGASCTVTVDFTTVFATRGVDRPGTITFTDTATASPQAGALVGHAN